MLDIFGADSDEDEAPALDITALDTPALVTGLFLDTPELVTGLFLDLLGEDKPGLVIIGGACNCCTNELLEAGDDIDAVTDDDGVTDDDEEEPLRPLSLSKTVVKLFLLTV